MPSWTTIVTNNLKLAAVGTVAVLLAGTGVAATSVTLSGSESDVPQTTAVVEAEEVEAVEVEAVEVEEGTVSGSDSGTVGIRPTDTHGYCVSTAVHAAKAAGGDVKAAKAAGKQACKAAKAAAKAEKQAARQAAKAAKQAARAAAKAAKQAAKSRAVKPAKVRPNAR